ncbi:MAG: short-chain dehydrogenase [Flammeovirgaceae bacterium]|nr:short-chain dehydrogenase [Flammeovirgaceae bacterium]|tara:strand:- start:6766 stop:7488 length:723 start_codon:yes stop_codon:yes gene_type:complete
MNDLSGKTIVVTGGEGLLGKAFKEHCAKAGATALSADIAGGDIHLDITDEQSVQDCVAHVIKEHGTIDGWINNAYPRTDDWGAKFEDITFESWKKNIDMHLGGYFLCCQNVLEQMKTQKSGSLINIGSIYGVVGPDFSLYEGSDMTMPAAYSAIKGGLINFTRYLASYYASSGLRVNAISPGGIENGQSEVLLREYSKRTPLGRMAAPEDIAPAAVYLLSNDANYVTGHNLVVDGGWTAV